MCTWCLQRSEENVESPGTEITDSYELLCGWLEIKSGSSTIAAGAHSHLFCVHMCATMLMWVLRVKLRLSGLMIKHFYSLSNLLAQCCLL